MKLLFCGVIAKSITIRQPDPLLIVSFRCFFFFNDISFNCAGTLFNGGVKNKIELFQFTKCKPLSSKPWTIIQMDIVFSVFFPKCKVYKNKMWPKSCFKWNDWTKNYVFLPRSCSNENRFREQNDKIILRTYSYSDIELKLETIIRVKTSNNNIIIQVNFTGEKGVE